MVARNSPEGLPSGWTADCKVLDSGRKLKYYTERKTGKKCYSKQEVYRYIKFNGGKAIKARKSNGNLSNGSMKEKFQGIQRVNTHLEWLPKGWLVEDREYEAGPKIGKTYKIYTCESTGHKCYSKPEVLRYLKKRNKGRMIRKIQKVTVAYSKSTKPTAKAQKVSTEATPEKSAGIRTYVARSLSTPDAYLNGVQTRGSKIRQQSDVDDRCTSTSPAKVLKADKTPPCGKIEMHGGNTTSVNRSSSALPRRFSKRLARDEPEIATSLNSDNHSLPLTAKRSGRDQKVLAMLKIDNMDVQDSGYESPSMTEVDLILKEENAASIRQKNSNSSLQNIEKNKGQVCRRFSNRLAGLEPKLGDKQDISEKALRGVEKRSCTDQALSVSTSDLTCIVPKACQQSNGHRGQLDKSKSVNGLEFDQSYSLGGSARSNDNKTRHGESNRLDLNEPVVIMEEAQSRSSNSNLSFPFTLSETVGVCKEQETQQQQNQKPIWHSWSDPCLEFAFKTLTGEISIEDDLQIERYFQQIKKPAQVVDDSGNTSLGSPDFILPMDVSQKSFSRDEPQEDSNSQQADPGDTSQRKRSR